MSFVAPASAVIRASRADCFARLLDFPSWRAWMPPSFRPNRGPSRPLQLGDRFEVVITAPGARLPLFARCRISRLVVDREVTWSGGVRGLIFADHSFFFEDADEAGATRVRSHETWSGALAGVSPIARRILAGATAVGADQLGALTRAAEKAG